MKERSTLVSSVVLLSVLAAGSYWMAERARLSDVVPRPVGHEVDYFVDNFKLTRMDEQGRPLYDLSAQRMTHYADDDTTDLLAPAVTSIRPDQPVVHMTAEKGHLTEDGEEVTLTGNVHIVRAATATNPELQAFGHSLVVYPETDIAKSTEPFEAIQGGSHLWGNTMVFNNTEHTLDMNDGAKARGHAVLAPHHADAPSPPAGQPASARPAASAPGPAA